MAEMDTLAGMPQPTRPRLPWIDLLRGLAVVGMIETHVMNVVLDASYDSTRWRHELGFFNGLLAPAFLWIAGFVQGLGVRRAQAQARPVVTVARLRRLGFVALLGYLLHVPWNLWGAGDFGAESWRIALQVDILPCMAVTLTMLLCAGWARGWWFDVITLACAAFFVFLAPTAQEWHTGVIFVDSFVTYSGTKSLFPLFPWVAFCAMGSFASRWEMSWKSLVPVSLVFIAVGMGFAPSGYSYVHPAFFAERLGWLGLLITAVWLFSLRFAPAWLLLVGRESLFIYVAHLLILFSVPWRGTTLNLWIGRTLSIPQTVIAFFIVMGICLALGWVNEWRRERKRIKQPLPL